MKPSIEKMFQKPYEEALSEIKYKIDNAVNIQILNNNPQKIKARAYVLKTLINYTEEIEPLRTDEIIEIISTRYGNQPNIETNIKSTIISKIQTNMQGFIGYKLIKHKRSSNTPSYFFRDDVANYFEDHYKDEDNYKPLYDIFLEILNNHTINN